MRTRAWSAALALKDGPHTVTLAHQRIHGQQPFDIGAGFGHFGAPAIDAPAAQRIFRIARNEADLAVAKADQMAVALQPAGGRRRNKFWRISALGGKLGYHSTHVENASDGRHLGVRPRSECRCNKMFH